jgi:glycosyltransferase involved in cell wall biosynthesis
MKKKKLITKVVLIVSGKAVQNKIFKANSQNPGVGGTEFVTIILAFALAKEREDYEVYLWSEVTLKLENPPKNLKQILIKEVHFPNSKLFNSESTILICPNSSLNDYIFSQHQKFLNKSIKCKIINWLHHPFNIPIDYKTLKVSAHVSVGVYQYFSNNFWYKHHWHIYNLFNIKSFNLSKYKFFKPNRSLKLVFLGALIPDKGFHYIAKVWLEIKKKFPNVQLDVIGSTQTYTGEDPESKKIPTTTDYANKIFKFIPAEDLLNKRVVFHGNLGEEKFKIIKSAHLAILNPTGRSEAFPASPIECLMCGTPVIASGDYGMSDIMCFFPEAKLSGPDEIISKLISIINNSHKYRNLQKRSLFVAKLFSKNTTKILLRWQDLIDNLSKNNTIINNPPISMTKLQFFYSNRLLLLIRILIYSVYVRFPFFRSVISKVNKIFRRMNWKY